MTVTIETNKKQEIKETKTGTDEIHSKSHANEVDIQYDYFCKLTPVGGNEWMNKTSLLKNLTYLAVIFQVQLLTCNIFCWGIIIIGILERKYTFMIIPCCYMVK